MLNPSSEDQQERRAPFPGPGARDRHQTYKFTPEELKVLKQCNKESFFQRCIPLSLIFGTSVYYGIQAGILKPNPRFGATPKIIGVVVASYFLGKLSYQQKCAEKLMQLPNSPLGEMLRQRRRGHAIESSEPGYGTGMALSPFTGLSSSDVYSDVNPRNTLDMDTSRPLNEGLDDTYRPSLDYEPIKIQDQEMPPEQTNVTTYEELRKKNREEYQQKRLGNVREPIKVLPPPTPVRPSHETVDEYKPPEHRNKYGDSME